MSNIYIYIIFIYTYLYIYILEGDWIGLRDNFTGNHRFSHYIWGFPVDFPWNQSIEKVFDGFVPISCFFPWNKLYGSGSGTCEAPILWDLGVWFLSFTMFHPLKYSRCLLSMKGKHQLPECKRLEKKVDVAHSTGSKNLRLSSQAFPGFIFEILHYHTQNIVNFNTKSHWRTISYNKDVYIYIYIYISHNTHQSTPKMLI